MAFLVDRGESRERSLPRGIRIRRGNEEDEFPTFEVMRRTMGYDMNWAQHAQMRHHLRTSSQASFWLAEETPRFSAPRVIGYGRSVVRDRVWSLTEFFLLPGHQRQGIGGQLLNGCLEDGRQAGADTHLVLASHHPGADSLYVRRAGCYPRLPMLLLAGPLSHLRVPDEASIPILEASMPSRSGNLADSAKGGPASGQLQAEPLVLTPEVQTTLDALDRDIVGYARPEEHRHWAAEMGGATGASRLFRRKPGDGNAANNASEIVGYAYIGPHSSGPALAQDPAALPSMLTHVANLSMQLARANMERELLYPAEQFWSMAGTNEIVLRWLLECGWQIVFQYLFMSSRPLGRPERYVCYNPLYVL